MSSERDGSMRRWAETAERIRATRKTSQKAPWWPTYLRTLDDARAGHRRRLPERPSRSRSVISARPGLGWAAISAIVQAVAGADDDALRRAYDRSSDLGTAVEELLAEVGHAPPSAAQLLTLRDVRRRLRGAGRRPWPRRPRRAVFAGLLRARGPADRTLRHRHPRRRAAHRPARGSSREGHRRGLRARPRRTCSGPACSAATSAAPRCWLATTRSRAHGWSLFHPLKSMLASPVATRARPSASRPPVWVEDKYDGIRAQLHKQGSEVRLFSRDLNDVTGQFPEVGARGRAAALGRHPRR